MCKITVLLLSAFLLLLGPSLEAADGPAKKKEESSSPAAKKIEGTGKKQVEKPQRLGKKERGSKEETAEGADGKEQQGAPAPEEASSKEPSTQAMRITGRVIYGSVYGELEPGQKVAVVDVSGVFDVIPAYRKIQRENLKKTKAQYHILMDQANKEFAAAVEAEALHAGFGLVIEKGGVTGVRVVDISEKLKTHLKN
ncbi:MAG: hypothetical protein V2A76_01575 [Planctomycetota bacterium]